MNKAILNQILKANYFDYATKTFIPENMKPRTLKTYQNHMVKMETIKAAASIVNDSVSSIESKESALVLLAKLVHWTHHKDTKKRGSKLAGLSSVSTSALFNDFCMSRKLYYSLHPEVDGICKHCYAINQQRMQIGVMLCGIRNAEILKTVLFPVEVIREYMDIGTDENNRIEAFGDVDSVTQARNYIRIAKAFPEKYFAAWSKNWVIWYHAFEAEGKPENMTFVVSSELVNVPSEVPEKMMKYTDHRFTVYDKDFAESHNIRINCGGRKCLTCLTCYRKNNVFDICELKK